MGLTTRERKTRRRLVGEVADADVVGVGRVAEVRRRVLAGQGADRGDHAAVELEIVVAVEDVVLAVVLVLHGHRDLD